MPKFLFNFRKEVQNVINELRIDSIREGNEMTIQQVVENALFEKYDIKHGSKNAPVVEEKEIEHEHAGNRRRTPLFFAVNPYPTE